MIPRLMVALIALSVAALSAQLPPEIADCKVYKLWQFSQSAEGWRPDHNVGPFAVKDGVLSFTNTGPDPWIINGDLGAPDCSRYGRLGIMMRSSVSGQNQIYFATDKSKLGEGTVLHCPIRGDGKYHFCEIDLARLPTWTGKLQVLRIDPVNGGSEVGAKVDIDWIALYRAPARITMGRPYVYRKDDAAVVSLPIRNAGGRMSAKGLTITAFGENAKPVKLTKTVEPLPPGESRNLTFRLPAPSPVAYSYILVSAKSKGRLIFDARLHDPVWNVSKEVRSPEIHLDSDGAMMWLYGLNPAFFAGTLRPSATLVYRGTSGAVHYIELSHDTGMLYQDPMPKTPHGGCEIEGGGWASFTWSFEPSDTRPEITITCTMKCTKAIDILRFEGPRLLVKGQRRHALLPGLQYLEVKEPYTATEFIGPKLADQHVPHPYKIAVPVMAVETKDGIIGVSWDPLQEWVPGHSLPCAEFESPSRSQGADNSLMTVFAPSIPEFVDENQDFAKEPYHLRPGEKMTLKMSFFAEAGREITDVIPDYFAAHGLPKAPPIAGGVEGAIATCFKAYAGTLYSKEANGWKNHFGLHQNYSPNGRYAALVLAESLRTSKPDLARKCDIDPDAQLTQYTGTSLDWFTEGANAAADGAIAKQSPDGGFPYTITEDMVKRIQDFKANSGYDAKDLGHVGETNSGLIARELGAILDRAERTGEKKYVDAGLLGLAKLNSFTVPRGAQTWEVHAHAPDVYAAALCVNCNIAGYHLTRDAKYLDHAEFWAKTGLPFVYSWVPPISQVPAAVLHFDDSGEGRSAVLDKPSEFYTDTRRHINPGSTIAVFGSSFYFVNWFGTPVQWCGLVWANSVRSLAKLRPDPTLERVADCVFASATQQQFDKGFAAGAYPDSWNLLSNTANTAFIAPDSILGYAYSLIGEKTPTGVSTESFKTLDGVARLNTFAVIEQLTSGDGALEAKLKFYAGQDVYSCLVKVDRPTGVTVDGAALDETKDLRAAASGWFYDEVDRALHVNYRAQSRTAVVAVGW